MCKPNAEEPPASGAKDNSVGDTTTEDAVTTAVLTDKPPTTPDATDSKDAPPAGKEDKEEPKDVGFCSRLIEFYWTNEFLILIVVAILLARAYPPLGADYLQPDITATWLAVCFIFLMAGLGLKTEEFSKAFQRIWFNLFVQCFNFFVLSSTIYGGSRLLEYAGILSQDLADGMVVD